MVRSYGTGLRVGDIDIVVFIDGESTRPAELFPLSDEFAFLVEDLQAVVATISDEQSSSRVHGKCMWRSELTGSATRFADRFDQLSVFRELQNPIVISPTMPFRDKDV